MKYDRLQYLSCQYHMKGNHGVPRIIDGIACVINTLMPRRKGLSGLPMSIDWSEMFYCLVGYFVCQVQYEDRKRVHPCFIFCDNEMENL